MLRAYLYVILEKCDTRRKKKTEREIDVGFIMGMRDGKGRAGGGTRLTLSEEERICVYPRLT